MARKKGVLREIEERRGSFALSFLALFAVTFGFLALVGATPDAPKSSDAGQASSTPTAHVSSSITPMLTEQQSPEEPVRVVAKSINLDATVVNPTSTDVDALDQALTHGAVRYPTSALLGQDGTVLIFGHSSYLPIVYHQYYKTFDGIQNLKTGDTVSVYSGDLEYRYSVTGVKVADATQDVIELPQDGKHLTLVTCDSFATKSNRFVVTADYVGEYASN